MSKVSGKTTGLFIDVARLRKTDVGQFFRGLSFGPGSIPEWYSWDDFCTLNQRLAKFCGSNEALQRTGELIVQSKVMVPLGGALRMGVLPRTLYWASHNWAGPSVFPSVKTTFEELGDGRLKLGMSIPGHDRPCPEFFHLVAGFFRALPRQLGLPDAILTVEVHPHRAIYNVLPPPSITIGNRLRRAFYILFSTQGQAEDPTFHAFRRLAEQHDELKESLKESERLRNEALAAQAKAEKAVAVSHQALQTRSEFQARMSHELRTPLNGIVGLTDLLKTTKLNDRQREYVHTISRCGDELMALIAHILDFSKAEAGKLILEEREFDLISSCEKVGEQVASTAIDKNLELVIRIGPQVPRRVNGDALKLRQVLNNLLSNAVKFTERGHVLLSVTATPVTNASRVHFEVTDTGIGIPPDKQDLVFESFAQADSTTTRRYGGTGLGLAIAQQLVLKMGGRIALESEAGEGSTFRFSVLLPMPQRSERVAPPAALIGQRALVVDDHPVAREALALMLAAQGMDCHQASSGGEALDVLWAAAAQNRPFDVVLIAHSLRSMSGPTLGRVIDQNPDLKGTRLICMAPMFGRDDECFGEPFSGWLTKPVTPSKLLRVLPTLLPRPAPIALVASEDPHVPEPADTSADSRVLVVDDDPVSRLVAERQLRLLGFVVDSASGGEKAIEMARKRQYGLILMDLRMPGVDGFETCRRIRREETERVPIYALTADVTQGDNVNLEDVGLDGLLTKPFAAKDLEELLRSIWGRPMAPTA